MKDRIREILPMIRERAFAAATSDDDPLDFFAAAREFDLSDSEAEWADEVLTIGVMRARGAL